MWVITIDTDKCQGDGECGNMCPAGILGLDTVDGRQVAVVTGSPDDCLGCLSCSTTCDQGAITVQDL